MKIPPTREKDHRYHAFKYSERCKETFYSALLACYVILSTILSPPSLRLFDPASLTSPFNFRRPATTAVIDAGLPAAFIELIFYHLLTGPAFFLAEDECPGTHVYIRSISGAPAGLYGHTWRPYLCK